MVADFLPAPDPRLPHVLRLPAVAGALSAIEEVRQALGSSSLRGAITLLAADWILALPELRRLMELLEAHNLGLTDVRSAQPETLVSAAALGLVAQTMPAHTCADASEGDQPGGRATAIHVQRGTLRAGDHRELEGSVLVLGDLNAGARLSASGDILVWGRLRGVAHAGCQGNRQARIVALQLRPLQLRIADAVARGPEEPPAAGLAEQARLVDGEIRIEPADPLWPGLGSGSGSGSGSSGRP